jgi:glycerol uptake facilitator-like aquaporin
MVLVYFCAKISGAHLNPAVSLTFTALGHINPIEMLTYWTAQIIGCILGALWIACLVPGLTIRGDAHGGYHGCFVPLPGLTNSQIFGWEALSTFNFLLPVFAVVWYTQNKDGYGNTGPIMVGLSLLASALACGHWTGAALNPARVIASPAVFNCHHSNKIVYYVLGELTGAILAVGAIIPWYGIAANAWYICTMPPSLLPKLLLIQPFKVESMIMERASALTTTLD